jgi:hypothetical protein
MLAVSPSMADVVISNDVTSNISCSGGVCVPTASHAVLNVGDLEAALNSGDVTVTTTGSGVQAKNIRVAKSFFWNNGNALSLDAYSSIAVDKPVAVWGTSALSLITSDGGKGGSLTFGPKGHIGFVSLSSTLTINGIAYRLENDLATLGYDVDRKPGGAFALAGTIDASGHGTWSTPPIGATFNGTLEGLGNEIAKLTIVDMSDTYVGLFALIGKGGVVRDIGVPRAVVEGNASAASYVGVLAGQNDGTILGSHSGGRIGGGQAGGGLIGSNTGEITRCWSSASSKGSLTGGLVGLNQGPIDASFATGNVTGDSGWAGGLVGATILSTISDSYATGQVSSRKHQGEGGFVGLDNGGTLVTSYSSGSVVDVGGQTVGGFLGDDEGAVSNDYWDTTTSGTNNGVNDGNEPNVTGLTTEEFQSGLPAGFDPTIWAEDPSINNGFPYLIANPPQ